MKKKGKIFFIDQGTYRFDVPCFVGCNIEEIVEALDKWLKMKKEKPLSTNEKKYMKLSGPGRTVKMRNKYIILILENFKMDALWIGALTHEAFHVVSMLFEHVDIKHDLDTSEEAWAYQIEYTVRAFIEKFKE